MASAAVICYNSTYHLHIGVQAKDPSMFEEYTDKDYEVRNFGEASFTRFAGPEETKSNETVTRYRIPYVTVIKKDSETGDLLKDAEFTLYAYDRSQGDFKKDGECPAWCLADQPGFSGLFGKDGMVLNHGYFFIQCISM